MLAINVSIPNLKIARLVQFWFWQFDVWTTNMNAHTWFTEQEHRLSMLLSQMFIYVKFSYAYQFTYQI